ncbi:MAG TPA: POTRA domain-containing protein [Thermoanaerobaculia bacterium]|nr:POTRA domain-containing protein [Thermoanaerobaculia bacterium]
MTEPRPSSSLAPALLCLWLFGAPIARALVVADGPPPPPAPAPVEEVAAAEAPTEPGVFGAGAFAAEPGGLALERLEREGAAIGRITIQVGEVFAEDEGKTNRRMHRLVNRLHRRTRDRVVRRQLLFREGDAFSARLLAESERILRERDYLFDAEIEAVGYRDGEVDVAVRTRDVWTLSGGVSFGREGGENSVEFEVQDNNFLGTGKEVGISRTETVDRTSNEILFRDKTPFGRHADVELVAADNSDGHRYLLHLHRPFYSLETRWSAGMTALIETRNDTVYDRGEVINRFGVDHQVGELYWGRSPGLVDGAIQRWKLGYTWESLDFSFLVDAAEPSRPPDDRAFSVLWADYEYLQDRFVEVKDLNHLARTEDLNVGTRMHTRVGWSSAALGATADRLVAGIDASWGFQPGPRQLLFAAAYHGARWGSDGVENLVVSGELRYHWRNLGRHALFARLHADWGQNLDQERPFQLGGDSGLRGYPLRFATGDRRALLNVEQRFFTDWEPLRLANVGAAVFFDVGRAWYRDDPGSDPGVLTDIGFGLRLSPTRSGRGSVLHLDVAFPLNGDSSIDGVQWLVTSKRSL